MMRARNWSPSYHARITTTVMSCAASSTAATRRACASRVSGAFVERLSSAQPDVAEVTDG
jgi:hypothetical protein